MNEFDKACAYAKKRTGVNVKRTLKAVKCTKNEAYAKSIVCKILRDNGWSFTKIGDKFNCDHTTIMYLVKKDTSINTACYTQEKELTLPY